MAKANKDKYCQVIDAADKMLNCSIDPEVPQLCNMTKQFTKNYCGDKKGDEKKKIQDFSAIMNYKLK